MASWRCWDTGVASGIQRRSAWLWCECTPSTARGLCRLWRVPLPLARCECLQLTCVLLQLLALGVVRVLPREAFVAEEGACLDGLVALLGHWRCLRHPTVECAAVA
jgi:hypothetical protein